MSIKKRICNICGINFTGFCDIERSHNKVEMTQEIEIPCLTNKEKTSWWVHFKVRHNHPNQETCDSCAVEIAKIAAKKLCIQNIDHETS